MNWLLAKSYPLPRKVLLISTGILLAITQFYMLVQVKTREKPGSSCQHEDKRRRYLTLMRI